MSVLVAYFLIDALFTALQLPRGFWLDTAGAVIAFGSLPAGLGIAILRHRLYDIDVVINRTVLFGLLAAFITAVYVGIVIGIGSLVGGRGNLFLSIVATAVVAVAFQPIRSRAGHFANRLVYGKRATPYEVLSTFSDHLGEAYSTEDILPRIARMVGEATGAERARVWVRVGGELRSAAAWPDGGDASAPLAVKGAELPTFPGEERPYPVRHQGELLGALSVETSRREPLNPTQEKLVTDLAGQVGLILRNVRLIEELRASRQRLAAAQDEERRRLERNIHDGAQQQLVALAVKIRLARTMTGRDVEKAQSLLEELQGETQDALENLRDLARGIYPPLLADKGLAAALEAQARKAPFPVRVEPNGIGRYPAEAEATAYSPVRPRISGPHSIASSPRPTTSGAAWSEPSKSGSSKGSRRSPLASAPPEPGSPGSRRRPRRSWRAFVPRPRTPWRSFETSPGGSSRRSWPTGAWPQPWRPRPGERTWMSPSMRAAFGTRRRSRPASTSASSRPCEPPSGPPMAV
ncbi:MAG: histidine kinase [Actinomycetota bacterium]